MPHFRLLSSLVIAMGVLGCNGNTSIDSGMARDGSVLRDGSAGTSGEDATMTSAGGSDSGAGSGGGGDAGQYPDDELDASCEGSACSGADPGPSSCNPDGLDAGSLTLRVCSDSVQKLVAWPQFYEDASCPPQPMTERCPLTWGCDDFDTARKAAALCNNGRYRGGEHTGKGWGFLIIGGWFGLSNLQAYYDADTGALVGYWEQDDVGEEICSGTIPDGASAEYTLTEVEQLCTPDGGPLSSVDAGDGG
jgi:hypothetical protein